MSDPHTSAKLRCLDAVCRDGLISPLDFRVCYLIASMMNRTTGIAFPRQATLAETLGVTRRSVQASLERLSWLGYLSVEVQRGRGHTNRYRLSAAYAGGGGDATSDALPEAGQGEAGFAGGFQKMRTPAHENANGSAIKGETAFAQNPFNNSFQTPDARDSDFEGSSEGVWVDCESMQADAWRRYWRLNGVMEPVRSNRTGKYARRLPSAWPPGTTT
ncbi:helix-turn-helix domain-containing protein [Streptomyces sp. AcH 505]|uniref:helix-turn-helix domain-containing protein n=1 Tax=Streptomyces sp. AcH 505 TaxID=352211 RepID=UPI00099C39F1